MFLLEKAFAKYYCSYEALLKGNFLDFMTELTGYDHNYIIIKMIQLKYKEEAEWKQYWYDFFGKNKKDKLFVGEKIFPTSTPLGELKLFNRTSTKSIGKGNESSKNSNDSLRRVFFNLNNTSNLKKLQALKELRKFNDDIKDEEKLMKNSLNKLFKSLSQQKKNCFENLRNTIKQNKNKEGGSFKKIVLWMFNKDRNNKKTVLEKLIKNKNHVLNRQKLLKKIIIKNLNKKKFNSIQKWNNLVKKEKICKFNGKITGMVLSLRKNHKHEMRSAFNKWSQKDIKSKYKRMALFLSNAKDIQQKETYVHMKILYMQKKFSKMCKILSRFLEFIETRKRENKLYAFDALCLDNPWTDKVPKLLACSRVMSAQMCFWKLLLTKSQIIKKRKQRGGGYKIDKLKFVMLENIFNKKISQFFMQIQIGRRNRYL